MTTRLQIAASVSILALAAAVVWWQLGGDEGAPASAGMEGHNHAAMASAGEAGPVRLDAEAQDRIGVTFATARRELLRFQLRAVGTVAYDETRLATLNPKVEGWVERLHVDFTGAPVEEGQALLELYSPRLVAAQEELILAARLATEATGDRAQRNARELLESARRRLAYWDVGPEQIQAIEESGRVQRTLTLTAPATGVVVEKNVVEGDRVMPGTTIYRIADLSRVWIEADVYEKDLGLVNEGMSAVVSFEAYPGRTFTGTVTYIYPTVSIQARTARLRVEMGNPDQDLKPGMYAQIRLEALASDSTVVVPRSAVLATGERTLIFVRSPDGTLVPRQVVVGRAAGQEVEILSGLEAGERVVSSAAFLVDAESNLGTLSEGMDGMGGMEGMEESGGAASPGSMEMPDSGAGGSPGDSSAPDHSGH